MNSYKQPSPLQSGMALMEVVLAAALMGGLALAGMTLFKNQNKAQKTVEQNYEVTTALADIRGILASRENCSRNFAGKDPVTVANVITSITKVKNGVDITPAVYPLNGNLPGTSLKINSYALSKSFGNLASDETMLVISFSRGKAAIKDEVTKTVKLKYTLNTSSKILTCYAVTGGESDSLWQIATNLTDIYYNSGNVGIGTSDPDELLTIVTPGSNPANNRSQVKLVSTQGDLGVTTDILGGIEFVSNDQNANRTSGALRAVTAGAHNAPNTYPTALTFHTHDNSSLQERVRVTSDGRLGVGTTTSNTSVQVGNITSPIDSMISLVSAPSNLTGLFAYTQKNNVNQSLGSGNPAGNNRGWMMASYGLSHASVPQRGGLEFDYWNGASWSTAVAMKPSGNVGIGTTNPTAKLDVNGKIRGTGTVAYDSSSTTLSTSSTSSVRTTDISTSIDVQQGDIVKVDLACNLHNSTAGQSTYMRIAENTGPAYTWLQLPNWITVSTNQWSGGYSTGMYRADADGTVNFQAYWHVSGGTGYAVYCNINAFIIGKQ